MEPSTNKPIEFQDSLQIPAIKDTFKPSDLASPIQSPNYKQDTTGWKLNSNGQVEFNNIYGALAGTKIYYVADSSGGAVTRKLTFLNGILVSET